MLEMSGSNMGFRQPGTFLVIECSGSWERGLENWTSERAAGERQVAADVKSVKKNRDV